MATEAAAALNAPPAGAPAAPPAGAPPAAAAPAAPAPPAGAPPAPPVANWHDGFKNAEVKAWAAAKGFPDAEQATESAYNLEKLIGHDKAGRTLVIPKDDAPEAEKLAFRQKLGVPDTPEGYKLPMPDGADPSFAKIASGWMHKAGIPPKQAEALAAQWNDFAAAQGKSVREQMVTESNKALADATTGWGKDADANLESGRRFASTMLPAQVKLDDGTSVSRGDFLERVFNSTGATRAMLELFATAGKGLGEHPMKGGGNPSGGSRTVEGRITELNNDAAFRKGDPAKVKEMQQLVASLTDAANRAANGQS